MSLLECAKASRNINIKTTTSVRVLGPGSTYRGLGAPPLLEKLARGETGRKLLLFNDALLPGCEKCRFVGNNCAVHRRAGSAFGHAIELIIIVHKEDGACVGIQ